MNSTFRLPKRVACWEQTARRLHRREGRIQRQKHARDARQRRGVEEVAATEERRLRQIESVRGL